jgi:hypothetical protein
MNSKPTSKTGRRFSRLIATLVLCATLGVHSVAATTYISAEPIPNQDVVGAAALATIERAGYRNLERWSNRLLDECGVVDDVIQTLRRAGAITTITRHNTGVVVGAGGFEAVTNPSFVFTIDDSGPNAVSAADVDVLDNALGYVLSQGGTAHFSPDHPDAYDFPLDYAVVTFDGTLTGVEAKGFFDYLGTIDPALWSGPLAGFTQIDYRRSPTNNSMLFLLPDVSKRRFITGLFTAAATTPGATYVTLKRNGQPTTALAGIAFPGNDWVAFPGGDQYLSHLPNPSAQLLARLAALRQQHLEAVSDLVAAIEAGDLHRFLNRDFRCPGQ